MLESASLPVLQKDKNKQNLSSVFLRLLRGAQNNSFIKKHTKYTKLFHKIQKITYNCKSFKADF